MFDTTPAELREELILVADDDDTIRMLVRAALESAGFRVAEAVNGEEALSQMQALSPSMILLDVEMPLLSGLEVCSKIRQQLGRSFPVLMITGKDDLESVEKAFNAGATDFLTKPFNWRILGHRVRYILRSRDNILALQQSASRLRQSQTIAKIGHWNFSWPDQALDVSASACAILGVDAQPARKLADWLLLLGEEQRTAVTERWHQSVSARDALDMEVRLQVGSSSRWIRVCAEHQSSEAGQLHFSMGIVQDISERKAREDEIRTLAYFDGLTGLANRFSFLQRLEQELLRAKQEHSALALLYLDLDHFKSINDTLGHEAGDAILAEVAARFAGVMQQGLTAGAVADRRSHLARLGGDEFTLMLPRAHSAADALALAERVRESLRQPIDTSGQSLVVTASIGMAMYPRDADTAGTLLKFADSAMYLAKDEGRDTARFYDSRISDRLLRNMRISNLLRFALERGEFSVEYQPIISAGNGEVTDLEALIRWTHPEEGRISPAEFIPLAESNGLIGALGEWVLRTACGDIAGLRRQLGTEVSVSVNVSAGQLRSPRLSQVVLKILRETGLPATALTLEITESVLIENNANAMTLLGALSTQGVRISLDDFGTGYASMSYLKRLPLDGLKIDRSFVADLLKDADDRVIVRAIILVAKELGLTVTAEGVETAEQRALLASLGCDLLQGFLFSPSVPLARLPALLASGWPLQAPAD